MSTPVPAAPKPERSALVFTTDGGIDPLQFIQLAEDLHRLIAGGLPGTRITAIDLVDDELRIEIDQ